MSDLKPSTLAAQALGWRDPSTGALVPSVIPSAPYERAPDGSYPGGHTYTRDQNPTYEQAEALLAVLEGGVGAKLFSSGMAAATTVFETLEIGTHVVAATTDVLDDSAVARTACGGRAHRCRFRGER